MCTVFIPCLDRAFNSSSRCAKLGTLLLLLSSASAAHATDLVVRLGHDSTPVSGVATDRVLKEDFAGAVTDASVQFKDVPPGTPLDVKITLRDGAVLQGADMTWYTDVDPADTAPQPMSGDDRAEITSIATEIPSFYSRSELLHLRGDNTRAVALVQLIRDTAFHADKGGEIIWRVELWYFENQAGGWAKVPQQNKVLRRERFTSKEAYDTDAGKIRWMPELGALVVKKDGTTTVDLSPVESKVTTP